MAIKFDCTKSGGYLVCKHAVLFGTMSTTTCVCGTTATTCGMYVSAM